MTLLREIFFGKKLFKRDYEKLTFVYCLEQNPTFLHQFEYQSTGRPKRATLASLAGKWGSGSGGGWRGVEHCAE